MLAVTTRNQLRGARFCLPMLLARRRIAQQLASQPGLLRYASGVSTPTEFFTLTVWENREFMQRFMQTGAHEQLMWQFTTWTSSFWGMRWEAGAETDEIGAWDGLRLSNLQANPRPRSPLIAAGLLPPSAPRAGPLGPRPEVTAVEPRASGMFALTARFNGPRAAARAVHRHWPHGRQAAVADGVSCVRSGVGVDWSPQALAISLWHDGPDRRARALAEATALGAAWAMCWQPADYEIGHWDGLRLRQAARRRARDDAR
ncbi:MAG TPA: antibiotic biosynthesis monooxygenase [Chloroflexota bacterium]|nr:antibiotic biosynthesis monooxygenase [Chloroflexota bacterium]